ncbi:hypothetical protein [Rubrivirga sp.]|uniref:hypothetical protein n=1 Tax=Rubrivirga sp. TaxID=1885344 RepID=UPI003B523CB2
MPKLPLLLAALALVGCAEEAADPVAEPPAEVVTEPADDVVVPAPMTDEDLADEDGMTEGEMADDTTSAM